MNKEKYHVLFLGSGMSKSIADVPIQGYYYQELSEYINNSIYSIYYKNLIQRVKDAGRFEPYIKDIDSLNIELYFSVLHELTYSAKSIEVKEAALDLTIFYRMITAIWLSEKIIKKTDSTKALDYLKKISHIITTNFDTLFEDNFLLENHKSGNDKKLYNYFNFPPAFGENQSNSNPESIQLLKLHGSINWFEKDILLKKC